MGGEGTDRGRAVAMLTAVSIVLAGAAMVVSTNGPSLDEPSAPGGARSADEPTDPARGTTELPRMRYACPDPVPLADIATGRTAPGTSVCVQDVRVVGNATWRVHHGDEANLGRFTVTDGQHHLTARINEDWWDHGTPAEGMQVVVEGTVAQRSGAWVIEPVDRWFDLNHEGRSVTLAEVAAGEVPEHAYVWVERAGVGVTFRAQDGDMHVEAGTLCPLAHLVTETTPPYQDVVPTPPNGTLMRVFGQVRYDPGHGWWEIHPIRAWERISPPQFLDRCPETDQPLPPPGVIPDRIPPFEVPPDAPLRSALDGAADAPMEASTLNAH